MSNAGHVASRVRWVESQLGKESLARRIARGDLFELDQIRTADDGVFMDALKVRLVPQAGAFQFGRPTRAPCTQITDGLDKSSPVVAIDARRQEANSCLSSAAHLEHQGKNMPNTCSTGISELTQREYIAKHVLLVESTSQPFLTKCWIAPPIETSAKVVNLMDALRARI